MRNDKSFTCPRYHSRNEGFHAVCPQCGRPFCPDYIDIRMHPRDPDLTGVCTSRFWIRIMLVLSIGGLVLYRLNEFGLVR